MPGALRASAASGPALKVTLVCQASLLVEGPSEDDAAVFDDDDALLVFDAEVVDDEQAVTDGNIITSRNPDDVPAFTEAVIALIEAAPARTPESAISEATA